MKYLIQNVTLFNGELLIESQDILISEGIIKEISRHEAQTKQGGSQNSVGTQIIEGEGLFLSPGFIDSHTHADLDVAFTDSKNFLSQGVTTVVGGNCGISCGNINNPNLEGVINPHKFKTPTFRDIPFYWEWIQNQQIGVNYASLIGQHTLFEESHNNPQEIEKNLEKYLALGYLGVSTGLVYGWGEKVNSSEDILPVAKVLAKNGAILTSHIKDQSAKLYESVKMFTDLWEHPGCKGLKIEISHLKHMVATDPAGKETLEKTLELLDSFYGRKAIGVDVYPYTAGATSLGLENRYKQCLNGWADVFPFGYSNSIEELAKEKNLAPEDIVKNILEKNPKVLAVYKNSCREEDMWEIMDKPYAIVASDGLPTHPRHWGTFTKVLRHALDNNLKIEDYLAKMTSLPANQFNLRGHGYIKEGSLANVTLLNPQEIEDTATYEKPESLSKGIIKVWVNGNLAYDNEEVLGKYGKVIKNSASC